NDSATSIEPWVSDGTASGTYLLKDIMPGGDIGDESNPAFFTEYKGKLYFRATDTATGFSIHVTDGTTVGTHKIQPPGFTSNNPLEYYGTDFKELGNALFFNANY